jgi:hypothetical protein
MAAKKSKAEIRQVQQTINAFEKRQKLGRKPLREDGDLGIATKRRIREAKYDLGYVNSKRTVAWGDDFLHRLRHPTLVRPEWGQTKDAVKRGRRRRITRRAHVARNRVKAVTASGVTTFDGVRLARLSQLRLARPQVQRVAVHPHLRTAVLPRQVRRHKLQPRRLHAAEGRRGRLGLRRLRPGHAAVPAEPEAAQRPRRAGPRPLLRVGRLR